MHLIGVDLAEREIRIARAERLFGTLRLTALERWPLEDDEAPEALLRRVVAPRPAAVLTALPAARATHRVLVLPFGDRRRLAQTVPLELAGQLPAEIDGAAVAFAPLGPAEGGHAVLAALARRADVSALAAALAAAGLAPTRVDLAPLPVWNLIPPALGDATLVHADGRRSTVSVRRAGRVAGLRALGAPARDPQALAAEVRWSLAALGGAPPLLVVTGAGGSPALAAALAQALGVTPRPLAELATLTAAGDLDACAVAAGLVAGSALRAPVGLALGGDAAAGGGSLRRAAALAVAALVLAVVDLGLVRHDLGRRDAALATAIRTEAAAALPDAPLVAPRAELEAAVAARGRLAGRFGGDAGALAVLRELSARLPPTLRLDLDELTVEPERVALHGRADSFDAVDALRRALAASPFLGEVTADETRTTVDGRGVEFRLHAVRRSPLGASS